MPGGTGRSCPPDARSRAVQVDERPQRAPRGGHRPPQVAATVVGLIRIEDVFARFGGEEFVVLTRGDSVQNAAQLGERLRRAIGDTKVQHDGKTLGVTVSIGVAELDEVAPPAGAQALVEKADARLYRAKSLGRNRVASTDS